MNEIHALSGSGPLLCTSADPHLRLPPYAGAAAPTRVFACLLRNFYGKDHLSIKKQVQLIQACFERYPKSIQDPTRFKKEVHTKLAVYDSLWRFFSKPSDKTRD